MGILYQVYQLYKAGKCIAFRTVPGYTGRPCYWAAKGESVRWKILYLFACYVVIIVLLYSCVRTKELGAPDMNFGVLFLSCSESN
jgi:hypothetical protein